MGECGTNYHFFNIDHAWEGIRVVGITARSSTANYLFIETHTVIDGVDNQIYPVLLKVHYDPNTASCATGAVNTANKVTFLPVYHGPFSRGSVSFMMNSYYSTGKSAFLYMGFATKFAQEAASANTPRGMVHGVALS